MIKIKNTDVYGFEAAIRGMRNPMNSWDKSDSTWDMVCDEDRELTESGEHIYQTICRDEFEVGANDLKLMQNLSRAGNDHAKFLRMINVTVDITAPLYWWKEFDTYKVGTVANSCSTMHKIHDKEFTLDDFSHEHLGVEEIELLKHIIRYLNGERIEYLKSKDKDYWWHLIQLLPSSYNQKRTVQLNYQVLKSMYFARRNHRLDEWHTLCDWMLTLPHFREVCVDVVDKTD